MLSEIHEHIDACLQRDAQHSCVKLFGMNYQILHLISMNLNNTCMCCWRNRNQLNSRVMSSECTRSAYLLASFREFVWINIILWFTGEFYSYTVVYMRFKYQYWSFAVIQIPTRYLTGELDTRMIRRLVILAPRC